MLKSRARPVRYFRTTKGLWLTARNSQRSGTGQKKTGGSNFLTPIDDRASKEVRDRHRSSRAGNTGGKAWKFSVEEPRRGRNGAEREKERYGETLWARGRNKNARIPARQNSHVIPRVEFHRVGAVASRQTGIATFAIGSCPRRGSSVRSADGSSLIRASTRVQPAINRRARQSPMYASREIIDPYSASVRGYASLMHVKPSPVLHSRRVKRDCLMRGARC